MGPSVCSATPQVRPWGTIVHTWDRFPGLSPLGKEHHPDKIRYLRLSVFPSSSGLVSICSLAKEMVRISSHIPGTCNLIQFWVESSLNKSAVAHCSPWHPHLSSKVLISPLSLASYFSDSDLDRGFPVTLTSCGPVVSFVDGPEAAPWEP